jgi:hypothetical protein
MNGNDWRPTPPEIDRAPEVALLAVLDHGLDVAAAALVAAHPNLLDDDPFYRRLDRPTTKAADIILTRVRRLREALHRYRRALAAPPSADHHTPADPDIPF